MGLFDSVYISCPKCGKPMEFQSKAMDDAYCHRFTIDDAPTPILYDIMNHPQFHTDCDTWVALIDPKFPPDDPPRPMLSALPVKAPDNPTVHFQGMRWWPDGRRFTYAVLEGVTEPKIPVPQDGG